MNKAELHLLINHLPVILPLVGSALLGIGIFWKSIVIRKVGLWILVVSAATAIPTYLTGRPAESLVKNYPGVSTKAIRAHESAAKGSLIAIEVVGICSLGILLALRSGKKTPISFWILLLVLSTASFIIIARTAHLGGEIRHEEIQSEDFF